MQQNNWQINLQPIIDYHVNKFSNSGLPKIALELEAKRLVNEAMKTYDPSKSQINTHITNYLRKMSRFVTNYQNIGHIPEHRALIIGNYYSIVDQLQNTLNREPTAQEIADAMHIPLSEVERLQSELRADLHMYLVENDDGGGGFFRYTNTPETDPKLKQAIDFVYFDSDFIDKKIMEGILGIYNMPTKTNQELLKELNITNSELTKRRERIAQKIKELYG